MIDEKILLSEISYFKKQIYSNNNDYFAGYMSAISAIQGMIARQEKIGKFISCTEQLPENLQDVLVLYKAKIDGGSCDGEEIFSYGIGYCFDKEWKFETVLRIKPYSKEVVAWIPLPEFPRIYEEQT